MGERIRMKKLLLIVVSVIVLTGALLLYFMVLKKCENSLLTEKLPPSKECLTPNKLSLEETKKLNFIRGNLDPDALREIENLSPLEILSKYSGYLYFNKTWSVDESEIAQVREWIKSKNWHLHEQGTIPLEYRNSKQNCAGALSCLRRLRSYAIGTINGNQVGPPDVCIEDESFFYMWLKEQPEQGEIIEKKTFNLYSWTFEEEMPFNPLPKNGSDC